MVFGPKSVAEREAEGKEEQSLRRGQNAILKGEREKTENNSVHTSQKKRAEKNRTNHLGSSWQP